MKTFRLTLSAEELEYLWIALNDSRDRVTQEAKETKSPYIKEICNRQLSAFNQLFNKVDEKIRNS